ncbi:hypothetical protein [Chloroflexus sp.]|jgi:hypothetical protein|uniref:hypothetical protein n=1 Tax=Chloroflexus sp. TaxID=1904827 RepID=UPI0021DCCCD5|nr:hypothetical protein [Chloroflexus sp.]GIV92911.1 MAG: hypothetical protein KatS3mg056_1620 [Chloroflexus sp.]
MTGKKAILSLITTALVLLLAACGGGTTSSSQPTPTTEEARPTRTPRPAGNATSPTTAPTTAPNNASTTAPTASAPDTSGGATTEKPPVLSTNTDLNALGNVQVEMKLEGTSQESGQQAEPFNLVMRQIILTNGDRSLTMESTSPESGLVRIISVQVGDQVYQYVEDSNQPYCMAMGNFDLFSGSMLTPDALIGSIPEAQLVERGVQVNGFTTDRYTFTINEQTPNYQGQAKGEIWASQNPAVVVRHIGEFTGTITGVATEEGGAPLPDQLGNLRWEYNVTQLAANTSITLPEACAQQQAAGADIPLPANISNRVQMGDLISFETSESPDKIVSFYQTEMAAQGWQAGEVSQYGSDYQLTFSKDGREVTILISVVDNKTSVIIMLASS